MLNVKYVGQLKDNLYTFVPSINDKISDLQMQTLNRKAHIQLIPGFYN